MPYQSPAILGATPLGGRLATVFANAGLRVRLYDKPSPIDANALGRTRINTLLSEYPSAALSIEASNRIDVRNYRDHLALLQSHDLIIDCSDDDLTQKQGLWVRLAPSFAKSATLISHLETSTVHEIASALPAGRRQHFFGAHFSLYHEQHRLLELITHDRSETRLHAPLETFFQQQLDCPCLWLPEAAPNMHRLATFLIASAYHHGDQHQLNHQEVELLSALLFGRGNYGVTYWADVLGLQRLQVFYQQFQQHEAPHFASQLRFPKRFDALIEQGLFGKERGQGIYDHHQSPAHWLNRSPRPPKLDPETIRAIKHFDFKALCQNPHPQAAFIRAYLLNAWAYAMQFAAQLQLSGEQLDHYGQHMFGWQQGVHALYQRFGGKALFKTQTLPYAMPKVWTTRRHAQPSATANQHTPPPSATVLKHYPNSHSYQYHKRLTLWQPKAAQCTLSPADLQELLDALHHARHNQSALLIYHHGECFGAPLNVDNKALFFSHQQLLNQVVMALRLNPFPIYASIAGQIHDHGYALIMQTDTLLTSSDSQFNLSAIQQNLPPQGGIWLEWLRRLPSIDEDSHLMHIHSAFKYLINNPSHSVNDARHVGILRPTDPISHHRTQLIQDTEQALQRWSQHQSPRSLRFGRASLNPEQLSRLKSLAEHTAQPVLYRRLLPLLARQPSQHNHSLSLSTLLGQELNLLNECLTHTTGTQNDHNHRL